ncbi:hypothetical protein [Micromonospora endophytica]|uniref:Uncharacterized protein n=1 Tax=Micromonospora endophytica TaxID=515350 RepID=A0A2W2BF36_9ACTN|nr:hypothetical protein [Micromonospora endophytica]PZF86211.1 hypothetical protein C1I93_27900 [Micromonospora endophytica]BCJ62712.1 hypothetical protein Jiend_61340 [Micromonospora endophytica]
MKATGILVATMGGLALGLLLPGTALAGAPGRAAGACAVTVVASAQPAVGDRKDHQEDGDDGGGHRGNRADDDGSDNDILTVVGGVALLAHALAGGVILVRRRRHATDTAMR